MMLLILSHLLIVYFTWQYYATDIIDHWLLILKYYIIHYINNYKVIKLNCFSIILLVVTLK